MKYETGSGYRVTVKTNDNGHSMTAFFQSVEQTMLVTELLKFCGVKEIVKPKPTAKISNMWDIGGPLTYIQETTKPKKSASNQYGHKDKTGTWIPNKIKTPKRGKGGKFSK